MNNISEEKMKEQLEAKDTEWLTQQREALKQKYIEYDIINKILETRLEATNRKEQDEAYTSITQETNFVDCDYPNVGKPVKMDLLFKSASHKQMIQITRLFIPQLYRNLILD